MDPYYEQRLRDEVIYLHSLWHQGPPRPAAAAVTAPPQLRPVNPTQFKKKKRKTKKPRAEIGQKSTNSAAETNLSGGAGLPCPRSQPPPSTTGGPSPAPKPQLQHNSSGVPPQLRPVQPTQFKKKKKKRPRAEIGQKFTYSAAETNLSGGAEWPCPPTPPPPSTSWPSPAPKPQSQPNLLSIEDKLKSDSRNAHRTALRVVCEFVANNYADDSDDIDSSSDEDDELMGEDYEYRFFLKVFKDDTELREFYEKNFARGEFSCLVCAAIGGKKSSKKFKGCLPVVQHSITIAKTKKRRAHRAFGQAICKVLGWDIDNLAPVVSMLGAAAEAGSSDTKESSMTLLSNVVSVNNGDVEEKDEEAVPESVDNPCGISVNGDEENVGAGSSDNMESSVALVSNVVSVNNDVLEDKNEAVPETVEIRRGIARNGDEVHVNPVTCGDAGINSEDDSMVHIDNMEKPASDGMTSTITCPDAGINLEIDSMVHIENVEKPASDGLTSTITCPDAGINLENDSKLHIDNVEKPASDGLTSTIVCRDAVINSEDDSMVRIDNVKPASDGSTTSTITCPDAGKILEDGSMVLTDNAEKPASDVLTSTVAFPDAGINSEDDSMVRMDNVEKPASDGLTSNSSACPGADKNLENLGSEYHHNMEETSLQGLTTNSLTSTDADKNSENHGVVRLLNMEDTAPELQPNVPLDNHVGDEVQDLKAG